ncbi:MAG: T9SS type A sorting domain-containing protein, partial [Crocinitomicaceae bacterium]
THVKIIDVVGMISGNHVQTDSNGNPINDPYPTAFASGGFDLDAVGVIHQGPVGLNEHDNVLFNVYPNPAQSGGTINVSSETNVKELTLISLSGKVVAKSDSTIIQLNNEANGIYILRVQTEHGVLTKKVLVQ